MVDPATPTRTPGSESDTRGEPVRDLGRTAVSWKVVFRRDRWTPSYKSEEIIVCCREETLQQILDTLHAVHPDAIIETCERLGETLIAGSADA